MLVSNEWIREHQHDLDGWVPRIEITRPGSKQTFTIKSEEAEREVVKVMRENRKKGEVTNGKE
jgi:hypothetical protein